MRFKPHFFLWNFFIIYGINNKRVIFNLYKHFATPEQIESLRKKFEKGIGWAEAKNDLFEVMNNYVTPMREKYEYYMSHPEVVNKYLEDGAKKARVVAKETIIRVKKAIGLID